MSIYKTLRSIADICATKMRFKRKTTLKISDIDGDSEIISIDKIGITDLGLGVIIFKTSDGNEFPISAFSAETAKIISEFQEGRINEIPTTYNIVEQVCEEFEIQLVKVRIYDNGNALRANLYFTGKKDLVLRNYRASDAIALAVLYRIPILIKKSILHQSPQIKTK
ncbi:MAG: DUF151 domain-containing protein [Nitrosarchaeum sp.]|nr:DUF151 domain-containing protein [Nitrosarchaeum sp.]